MAQCWSQRSRPWIPNPSSTKQSSKIGSKYNKIIKGYGKKLFVKRTAEERAGRDEQIRKAYAAFYDSLSPEVIKKKGYLKPKSARNMKNGKNVDDEEDEDEDEDDNDGDWFAKGKIDDTELESKAYKVAPVTFLASKSPYGSPSGALKRTTRMGFEQVECCSKERV